MLKRGKIRFSSEAVLSLSAVAIAVASIFISVWQGLETRKHNRLSVRPNLEIHLASEKDKLGYFLVNTGLGPALITKSELFFNDTLRDDLDISDIPGFFNVNDATISFDPSQAGSSVLAGERIDVIMFISEDITRYQYLLKGLSINLGFTFYYESMYGEKFICSTLSK